MTLNGKQQHALNMLCLREHDSVKRHLITSSELAEFAAKELCHPISGDQIRQAYSNVSLEWPNREGPREAVFSERLCVVADVLAYFLSGDAPPSELIDKFEAEFSVDCAPTATIDPSVS